MREQGYNFQNICRAETREAGPGQPHPDIEMASVGGEHRFIADANARAALQMQALPNPVQAGARAPGDARTNINRLARDAHSELSAVTGHTAAHGSHELH